MYAYYVVHGHTLDHLLNLSMVERMFYSEAMAYEIERENERMKIMLGGGQ